MSLRVRDAAKKFLQAEFELLREYEQRVIRRFTEGAHVARDVNREFEERLTFGESVADRVAAFGGSWTFILLFVAVLIAWVVLNSIILARRGASFDPYPYILLNLFLSMVAALQVPVIMMSQNRQAAKDRLNAEHDYEINLKAELEVRMLHEKLDALREVQWMELVAMRQEQIRLLTELAGGRQPASTT